jgi:hypothetical protein
MLCCFRMIKYEGNRTLVTVSLENLNKVFSNYPEAKITISRKWADKYNAAMTLAAGMPVPEVGQKVKVQTEKVETKTNETNDNEEVIPYKTIN